MSGLWSESTALSDAIRKDLFRRTFLYLPLLAILTAFKDRNVTAVPEIMGGHMGGGISFRRALEELRQLEASL